MKKITERISKEEFIKICEESNTMKEASAKMNIHFNTLKKYAIKWECYQPNKKFRKSGNKLRKGAYSLVDILMGKLPTYPTTHLRKRLIKCNLIKYECEKCNIIDWNNNPISLELDHINGNKYDHRWSNLRLLCPNCHSQTKTYKSKNNNNNNNIDFETETLPNHIKEKIINIESGNIIRKKQPKNIKYKKRKLKKSKTCQNSNCHNIHTNKKYCTQKCYHTDDNVKAQISKRKVERPPYEQLIQEIEETNYSAVGRKYGVSDNAIRKWVRFYEKYQ